MKVEFETPDGTLGMAKTVVTGIVTTVLEGLILHHCLHIRTPWYFRTLGCSARSG